MRLLLRGGRLDPEIAVKTLHGAVVVIVGASSGIGRAAALAFARAGAHVVAAARRREPLERLAEECARLGPAALAVPADVTDPEAAEALARAAEKRFGRIDVWINNAGTGVFGPFQDAPLDLHRRTIEVNLLGTLHGAYAALPRFLDRRRGILINMISLGGWAPTPFAAAYTASKFGLRGLTASLRQEMRRHPHIHVCGVFPAMVDTPGFVHGANVSGRTLDPGPLLYAPEEVAATLVYVARHPRDEIAVGWPARAAQVAYALAPGPTEHLMGAALHRALDRAQPAPVTHGALRRPIPEGTTARGGWLARKGLPSASILSGIGLAVAGTGLALALDRRAGRRHRRLER
nr:SDR family oxidoreductase [Methylorubrum zatmanii]